MNWLRKIKAHPTARAALVAARPAREEMAMSNLARIDPATASLPTNYEAACVALAECDRVDECQEWADKMAALASYARQREDKTLENYCRRILARAVRREGEILQEIEPAKTGPKPKLGEGDHIQLGRVEAAREAGLSDHQRVTALRVANVPADKFEAAIDSDDPPSVTALAEQGRIGRRPSKPPVVKSAPAARRSGRSASLHRDTTIVGFSTLLHSKPAETLADVRRMLSDERGHMAALPFHQRVAIERSLRALGDELDELSLALRRHDGPNNGSVIDRMCRSVVLEGK